MKVLERILFTHNDLDGAGSAVVYSLANHYHFKNGNAKIIYSSNNDIDFKVDDAINAGIINSNTEIIFADICPTKSFLEKMSKKFTDVTVIDHHVSNTYAMDIFPKSKVVVTNKNGLPECGANLLYGYYLCMDIEGFYVSSPAFIYFQHFVETVRSYDTYEWKSTNNILAKKLQMLFRLLKMEEFVIRMNDRFSNPVGVDEFLITNNAFISIEENKLLDVMINNEIAEINRISPDDIIDYKLKDGLTAAVFYAPSGINISELSYRFLTRYRQYDVFIGLDLSHSTISIRSISDNIDVSKYALELGGGGHQKASGAPISEMLKEEIIKQALAKILA